METRQARTRVLAYAGLVCGAAAAWLLLAAGSAQADEGLHAPIDTTLLTDQGPTSKVAQSAGDAVRSTGERGGRAVERIASRTPVGGAVASRAADEVDKTVEHATATLTEVADEVDSLLVQDAAPEVPSEPPSPAEQRADDPGTPLVGQPDAAGSSSSKAERAARLGTSGVVTAQLVVPHVQPQPTLIAPAVEPPSPVDPGNDRPDLTVPDAPYPALVPAPGGELPAVDALPGHRPATPGAAGDAVSAPPEPRHPSPFATPDVSPD